MTSSQVTYLSRGLMLFSALGISSAIADVRYVRTTIGSWPSGEGRGLPADINVHGQVCGALDPYDSNNVLVWDSATNVLVDVGGLYSPNSTEQAGGMNDNGVIVGVAHSAAFVSVAWIWTQNGGTVELGGTDEGMWYLGAAAINNAGTIVGAAIGPNGQEGVLWTKKGQLVRLGRLPGEVNAYLAGINESNVIVGQSGGRAFIWRAETGMVPMVPANGFFPNAASAINNFGQIVGRTPGFMWDPQTGYHELGEFDPNVPALFEHTLPTDINDASTVVGVVENSVTYHDRNFVWDPERGMRDLHELVDRRRGCSTDEDLLVSRYDIRINNRGQIVCARGRGGAALLTPYLPGDLDPIEGGGGTNIGDGDVDLQDLASMLSNFGRSGDSTYAAGDLDCDRDTDLEDLAILLANFGETLP